MVVVVSVSSMIITAILQFYEHLYTFRNAKHHLVGAAAESISRRQLVVEIRIAYLMRDRGMRSLEV